MNTKIKEPVLQIIEDAKTAAHPTEGPTNFITARTLEDRKRVNVQMHIAGVPGQWIEYDSCQLAELIRILQTHQNDLQ